MKKRGLGKGLEALLKADIGDDSALESGQQVIAIDNLQVNPYQPRKQFDNEALAELADSVRQHGIIQPLVVRALDDERYELIAGERRLRAATMAGLEEVPVVVRNVSDEDSATFALIENIQREDLNVIEKAQGIKKLCTEFSLTHQECARILGQSRSSVTNLIRLLELESAVQQAVIDSKIDMGHARALLAVDAPQQHELLQQIGLHGLTVRETEALIQNYKKAESTSKQSKRIEKSAAVKELESKLASSFDARVSVKSAPNGVQKVSLQFADEAALNRWLKRLDIE